MTKLFCNLGALDAHLTPAHARPELTSLQGLWLRLAELIVFLQGGQPETEFVGEIMARATSAVTLDEGRGAEIFETRAGTGERLAATFSARGSVLGENKHGGVSTNTTLRKMLKGRLP